MKRAFGLVLFLVCLVLFAGCGRVEMDELYSLPQPQEEFLQLQTLIDAEIAAGSEYSAPTSGSQRQSVQLVDIDGDGMSEALAFLKTETVPVICVFRVEDEQYVPACTITGEGTAIGRVEYSDLDGDGIQEVAVSWKVSGDIAVVKAYSLAEWDPTPLMTASCRDFLVCDMDSKGNPEVMVLDFGDDGGAVDMYFTDRLGEMTRSSAPLSASLESLDRFRYGTLSGGTGAIFAEGRYQDNDQILYLTDILVSQEGNLFNITMDRATGNSDTHRAASVYCQDIDGDGVMEVPFSKEVFRQSKNSADYYVFDWYSYDRSGTRRLSSSTYHCYNDGWYYVLPEEWRETLTVRRESGKTGERTVVLSTADKETGTIEDRMTVFTLSGENRWDRAKLPGRFVLLSGETTIYAAKLHGETLEPLTEEVKGDIAGRFHLIYSEWMTGAV